MMSTRYQNSEEALRRALNVIPLGAQTFSKSLTAFPHGVSPYFVAKAKGAYLWDVDGNRYLDFINGLLAVTLGYDYEPVSNAVCAQIRTGVSFSLSHPLEAQVAEKLVALVPSAEKVRFGKNGSDATSAAIRLARAYTGREHIAVCGYHGWQDWYIGSTTRSLGVPKCVQELTHRFVYNDIQSLINLFDQHPNGIAAVIMEPMNVEYPRTGFLEDIRALCTKHGTLLVFDETITGCRFAKGGAQEYFGITPDLSCFGKGLANGFPLSAIVGRKDVMDLMEKIFFSGTFSGETASLAAANTVLETIMNEPVIERIGEVGRFLIEGVDDLIRNNHLSELFSISGHPSWTFLTFKAGFGYSPFELRTLYLQEIFKRGVLSLGTHNVSYAHTKEDVDQILAVYSDVLPLIGQHAQKGTVVQALECDVLEPLFKVR